MVAAAEEDVEIPESVVTRVYDLIKAAAVVFAKLYLVWLVKSL
jgi:hypothetical protein